MHICGIDIVRDEAGEFCVLEDNARTPSGVSYVVENRHLMLRAFPDLIAGMRLRPVDDYGRRLREAMTEIAPEGVDDPQVVLLSPGIYNSAYFEHVFLAREMGVPLVEGADLCGRGRPGLDAHHRRPAPGAHDLPPHRRRFPRPHGVPARQHAGRARADRRLAARAM